MVSTYIIAKEICKLCLMQALRCDSVKVARVDWLGNSANFKEDYSVSLFHVVCTVKVMIFCSRCDALLVYWPFVHLHTVSKPFLICARSTSYCNREKENKNIYTKESHQVS